MAASVIVVLVLRHFPSIPLLLSVSFLFPCLVSFHNCSFSAWNSSVFSVFHPSLPFLLYFLSPSLFSYFAASQLSQYSTEMWSEPSCAATPRPLNQSGNLSSSSIFSRIRSRTIPCPLPSPKQVSSSQASLFVPHCPLIHDYYSLFFAPLYQYFSLVSNFFVFWSSGEQIIRCFHAAPCYPLRSPRKKTSLGESLAGSHAYNPIRDSQQDSWQDSRPDCWQDFSR